MIWYVEIQVQRSLEDRYVLVATYEGEHNHPLPSSSEISLSPTHHHHGSPPPAVAVNRTTVPSLTLDQMMQQHPRGLILADDGNQKSVKDDGVHDQAPAAIQQILVQMAASLTQDRNFKAAIAAAIWGRFVDQSRVGQW